MCDSNKIMLIGDSRKDEALASGTVKPGHLLEVTSANAVKVHATEGGYAERMFAIDNEDVGEVKTTSYTDATRVKFVLPVPGSVVQVRIPIGANIAIGDELVSKGDGTLIEDSAVGSGVTVKQIIAYAIEAKDNTVSGAAEAFIAARIV